MPKFSFLSKNLVCNLDHYLYDFENFLTLSKTSDCTRSKTRPKCVKKNSREAEGYAQILIFDQKLVDCRIAWMSLSPVFCLLTGWVLHFPKLKSRTVENFPVIHPRLWPAQCWYTCVKLIFITHPPVFRVTSNLGAVWLGPQCHVSSNVNWG